MITINSCPVCGSRSFSDYLELKDFFLTQETFNLQQCASCGFVFTNPHPDDKSLPKYYDSPDYLSHHSQGFNIIRLVYQGLRKINIKNKFSLVQRLIPGGSLLDIGCGTGELLHYFQKKKWNVTGIEPFDQAREFAIMNYGLDVREEFGIRGLPQNSFDVITLWHVLEHVADLEGRIREIFGLLKSSGYVVVALPNLNSWDALHYGENWAAFDVPRHLHHFSKSTIVPLLEKYRFHFLRSFPLKMDAYFISMLSEKYKGKHNPYLRAAKNGYKSNIRAKVTGEYSSLVYVFQK